MMKEEVLAKRNQCITELQNGVQAIEQLKAQVAGLRGKIIVYNDLLKEFGELEDAEISVVEEEAQ